MGQYQLDILELGSRVAMRLWWEDALKRLWGAETTIYTKAQMK